MGRGRGGNRGEEESTAGDVGQEGEGRAIVRDKRYPSAVGTAQFFVYKEGGGGGDREKVLIFV